MRSLPHVALLLSSLVLVGCGGIDSDPGADGPADGTVTVTETVTAAPGGTGAAGPVQFRDVIGSDYRVGCSDGMNPAGPAEPSATGIPVEPGAASASPALFGNLTPGATSSTTPSAPQTANPTATESPAPTDERPVCDQGAFDALVCDEQAQSLPTPVDEVVYLCQSAEEGVGDLPATPPMRFALGPARIVGGVVAASYEIPEGQTTYVVNLELGGAARDEFTTMSRYAIKGESGDKFAIVVGGRVVSAPYFSSVITNGRAEINGNFTEDQARELAEAIEAGG